MKNIILVLILCLGVHLSSAQEVYNSSGKGKPGFQKKTKKKKGYDPDKLVLGGSLNAGYYGDYANAGIAPFVGYRFAPHFSAGVSVGYQFYKYPEYYDYYHNPHYAYENIVFPAIWARYFVYRNIFVDATFEYDFINTQYPPYTINNPEPYKTFNTNSCFLIGVGIKQPLGGRFSGFAELFYDVLQNNISPYYGPPQVKVGFGVGI